MSQLLEKCKQAVDSVFISWEKTILSTREKRTIEEYEAWGMVHLALYILEFNEYNAFKMYIYQKYGYDPGGCTDGQISIFDLKEDK